MCDRLFQALPQHIKERLSFVLEDINDTDLLSCLSGIEYEHVLIFCNNLAFTEGTLNRYAFRTSLSRMVEKILFQATQTRNVLDLHSYTSTYKCSKDFFCRRFFLSRFIFCQDQR